MSSMSSDWEWRLRLFLSADLIGSTAFKASTVKRFVPEWAPTFRDFFRDFPQAVEASYHEMPEKCVECDCKLSPWKFSGDEILFWVELKDHREVASHIGAFKRAVLTFPQAWERKELPLRLKAAAWLAGFPVTNTAIKIGSTLDFIGPSIDIGFRIAKFADGRRFPLSADLALMLLDAVDSCEIDRKHFHLYLHGRELLKGVTGGAPYPIVWLDMNDGEVELEEKLLGVRRDFQPEFLKDFLRDFIDKTPALRRPFIHGDNTERYGTVSEELDELRRDMQAEDTKRTYLTTGDADNEDTSGPTRALKDPPETLKPKIE